ncbi:sulfatase-like hydrolase/transferase [Parapusillimonas granuli]|uniref:Sulfatase-like hydrolase/transferase n=1 Tax=Parapusillimonas granuli TaxID=380911 RepID=A0A853G556_9BURK|nr:sulfatase-like hydrolase/transferase [Parapusillimonas granuli]MBB5214203.1 arylsulfatase A-like enzyme [Parapusillimonas granuli]MEB2399030.1 sulfatase-like hydrolase/transferase [Alcaligenaceae bacterium]NYT51307.1 sulfatase-like hydrolase/transferase [Parapusillimonas granuli]
MNKTLPALFATGLAAITLSACDGSSGVASSDGPGKPNILFVIMDDVGIDQMASFGYGGAVAPKMPNMDAVATAGIRFRNTWSMPECSPGRAAFFLGRYPMRTHIFQAIGPNDLANSQVSPYEMTAPKVLKRAGYESAMFGKFHLAGPENNEAGNATPSVLGWDYFYGWVGGLPGSVDATAGGAASSEIYSCGFVPGKLAGGADTGACHQPDGRCSVITGNARTQDSPGLQCLDSGGIFVPNQTCGPRPSTLDFTRLNGYYVSPLVIIDKGKVEEVPPTDARARGYRTRIETDAAIDWINTRAPGKPWMATVSYTAAHTPWQQPPRDLLSASGPVSDGLDCKGSAAGRLIQDKMTEAMDTEFGRLLVETGLARRGDGGKLVYDPKATNTVIVIMGDNGSLGTAVKQPFIPGQAKGTAYQTGVWDPLIIAGPQVAQPGREVGHMVNAVDLFQLFGELAGLDVHKEVPGTVDSVGVLPYLKDPAQPSLRSINFTMGGLNQQANGARNGPCVISGSCTHIPTSKSVCEDNQGVWWGPGYTSDTVVKNGGAGYEQCVQVNQALFKAGRDLISIMPETSAAIRDERYKLVRNITPAYDTATDSFVSTVTEELYEVNQAAPVPLLDTPDRNLLLSPSADTQAIHERLQAQLDRMLASAPDCPGDGNMDGVVDGKDLDEWGRIAHAWGLSSVYDFVVNGLRDGLTNTADAGVIQNNLGKTCERSYGIY